MVKNMIRNVHILLILLNEFFIFPNPNFLVKWVISEYIDNKIK